LTGWATISASKRTPLHNS